MKKLIIIGILCVFSVQAAELVEFQTLQARFEQSVTNDQAQTLRYSGSVWLKQPDLARWHYAEPIEKTIYIQGHHVVIVEPDLFQATRFESPLSLNILEAWQKSKPVKAGERLAIVGENRITIQHEGGFITSVFYRDSLDNEVSIRFFEQEKNPRLEPGHFVPDIPKGFDIIVH